MNKIKSLIAVAALTAWVPASFAASNLVSVLNTLPFLGPQLSATVSALPVIGAPLSAALAGNNTALAGLPALGDLQALTPSLIGLGDVGFNAAAPLTVPLLGTLSLGGGMVYQGLGLPALVGPGISSLLGGAALLQGAPLIGPLLGGPLPSAPLNRGHKKPRR